MANPLVALPALPPFEHIAPTEVAPAIRQVLDAARGSLAQLQHPDTPASWADFVQPLIDCNERVSRSWGVVSHLHGVMDTPDWREAYNTMLPEVTRYWAELGQNLALFEKYKAIRQSPEYASLSPVRQRIVDMNIRDFRLSGAELPETDKPRFQAIQEELAGLSARFSENLLDATNAWTLLVEQETELAGLPSDALAAAQEAATRTGKSGWVFTLHFPSYFPVMQYAENRHLREQMYRAYATRASECAEDDGAAERDNSSLMVRILALRAEEASLLGYPDYASVSLVPKMANSADEVLQFLGDLARRAKPFAERDFAELQQFAAKELGLPTLEAWDIPWASEKLRQARYAFSEHEVKQYFPEPKVLAGLFHCIESLYGVSILPDRAETWHADVRFFRIERAGQTIGHFYLDLYARDTKRGGAWMDSATSRRQLVGSVQTPVAYLVCNFSAPIGGKPATFTHDEVQTLFHECGHGLHHLLTRIDELPLSGISGVEWDAVELPSQFMENFCWEWDLLQQMTSHVDTGEPLPRTLFDKMIAARNFQSGMQTVRQIEFALFDMRLHHQAPAKTAADVLALLNQVRTEVAVVIPPAWQRFPHSFSHIFAGGYAAGYYSYKWAEVLSADAYAAFEEAADAGAGTTLDRHTGERFLQEILGMGGARPAIESFSAFRGRKPQIDALLRHQGMQEAA